MISVTVIQNRHYLVFDVAALTTRVAPFELNTISLFQGKSETDLAEVAPYLVPLDGAEDEFDVLIADNRGKPWGILLASSLEPVEVRRHLRKFLMVEVEDGRQMYFRFYDPRVLRVFLPTCTPEQLREFFGPITAFLAHDEDGKTCTRYTLADDRLVSFTFEIDGRRLRDY